MVSRTKIGQTNIRLAKPYVGNKSVLMELLSDVIEQGLFSQGKYVSQLENSIARYLGVKDAIAVSSGTAALHLALIALRIGPGDEVIVPAYTFPATANVVELVGAKPVFVDVDLRTYNIDYNQIVRKLTKRTKAIIPVHLFGNPCDMDSIRKLARSRKIKIIEDSAGAFGSEYKKKKCGTIGDLGCFSFHPRKIITTGEGGMVVTNNKRIADKILLLRNHGMRHSASGNDFVVSGFNYRMNELEAVLGIVQMQEIKKIIKEREQLVQLYKKHLHQDRYFVFQAIASDCKQVTQAFVIRLNKISNTRMSIFLKKRGIETTIGAYALQVLKFYEKKYRLSLQDYPIAYRLYRYALALPLYNGMTKHTIKYICDNLKACLCKEKN